MFDVGNHSNVQNMVPPKIEKKNNVQEKGPPPVRPSEGPTAPGAQPPRKKKKGGMSLGTRGPCVEVYEGICK